MASPEPQPVVEPDPTTANRSPVRLGEDVPIFCEHCGYPLHAAPQHRCGQCHLLYFRCPECGKNQPINSLRPTLARMALRLRFIGLIFWVLIKLGAIVGGAFMWFAISMDMGHMLMYGQSQLLLEVFAITVMFGLPYGGVLRLLFIRYRHAWVVGVVLALMAMLSIAAAALLEAWGTQGLYWNDRLAVTMPFIWSVALATMLGAVIAWPLWVLVVRLVLPSKSASLLLHWQRQLSINRPPAPAPAR